MDKRIEKGQGQPPAQKFHVEIKLVSVDFVPTWQIDEKPGVKHTCIGQMSIETKDLPQDLQDRLVEICREAWEDHLKAREEGGLPNG